MKNIKRILLTLTPSLIVLLSFFVISMATYPYDDYNTFIVVAYILSISLLVAWVKRNFDSLIFLAVGFAIPPLLVLVYEFFEGGWFQYLLTFILALTYSLPFIIITVIIIIIRKKVMNQDNIQLLKIIGLVKVRNQDIVPLLKIIGLILAIPVLILLIMALRSMGF